MKKVISIYGFILLGLILILVLFKNTGGDVYKGRPEETAIKYDLEYEKLSEGVFRAFYQIPDDSEGLHIAFPTYHFGCKVMIDDEIIYQIKLPNSGWCHSTGFRINFVELKKQDSGKIMTIIMDSNYSDNEPKKVLYAGNEIEICKIIVKQGAVRFLLACIILIMGIVLFLYSVFFLKLKNAEISMVHFSAFSISLAVWAILQSEISNLIPKLCIERMLINHYMLMFMPIFFILFVKGIYTKKSQRIWSYCMYMLGSIVIIRTLLQFVFNVDFKQTLRLTHIGIVIFAIVGIVLTIKEVAQRTLTKKLKVNLLCIVIIMFSTGIELGCFCFTDKRPVIGMLGFLVYVLVISIDFMRTSRMRIEAANKAEIYRNMAYLDELTGVYSRTAFHKHMKDCDKIINESDGKNDKNFVIFMFDLNDLKKCNDNFGHEYGDHYLVHAAEAIKDIFNDDCGCYRIGGDEFCVITLFSSVERIEQMLKELELRIEKINEGGFVVHASVASGYAVFDKNLDENLEQTMARADEMMYKKKHKMKYK